MNKAALWLGAMGVAACVAVARPASAAEMFADVPTDHWAYQAVSNLQERGIVIGYPDGTFGGKRAMTRYEFAVAIDRLVDWVNRRFAEVDERLSRLEGRDPVTGQPGISEERVRELIDERIRGLPTRDDLETIRRLVEEFRDELAALGTNVEALRRDVDSLKARVGAIEERLNRWHFTGEATLIARGERGLRPRRPAGTATPGTPNPRRATIDLDSRVDNNGTSNILEASETLYNLDFGIVGNISPGVTANALLNFGNYLPWASADRQSPGLDSTAGNLNGNADDVSRVQPIPEDLGPGSPAPETGKGGPRNARASRTITQGNFGKSAVNSSYAEFTPVKLYLNGRIRDLFFLRDIDATVGKFGTQFTPYTLRQVDPDSYADVTLTDNGEIIMSGAMGRARIGGLNLHGYAANHYNARSVNSGYPLFITYGGPRGVSAIDYGGYVIDQSSGVHGTFQLGRFNIGGTYILGGISRLPRDVPGNPQFSNRPFVDRANPKNDGRAMIPRRAEVYGADIRFPLFGRLAVAGEFASSTTLAGLEVGDRFGVYGTQLKNAYDAKLSWGAGRLSLAGGYKQIDPFFGAPGSWGSIGRWKNPTNIQGWNAAAGYNFGNFTLKGSIADYDTVKVDLRRARVTPGGVPAVPPGSLFPVLSDDAESDIRHFKVGLSFNLNPNNAVDLGWEQARIRPWDVGATGLAATPLSGKTKETYWTIGLGHTFNQNTLFKVMYQIIDYRDNGAGLYTVPGGAYKGGIGVGQLSVRF